MYHLAKKNVLTPLILSTPIIGYNMFLEKKTDFK